MNKNLVLSVGDLICVYGTAVRNWVRYKRSGYIVLHLIYAH